MDTTVVVAIVAATAAVVAPVLTWLAARQDANDVRANIARDIELLNQLASDSDVRRKLNAHVAVSIKELIRRDENRRKVRRFVRFGIFPYTLLLTSTVINAILHPETYGERYFTILALILNIAVGVWLMIAVFKTWPLERKSRTSDADASGSDAAEA